MASVGEGAVYGLLGWRTSKRSWIALAIGIVLFALDTVLLLVGSAQPGQSPPTGGLVARIFLFIPLVNGLKAARSLRTADQAAPSGATT